MAEDSINQPIAQRTERIGKYEIVGHIATGGMGVIYKAYDVDLDRFVALKVLPPDLAKQDNTLIRFCREARAAAQLRHDNIVSIFEIGESHGTHYIALEYIEGTDLQDYINRKCKLDPEEARQIMIQAARALVHAFENGIVHRDIKPSNFLLTRKEDRLVVKLTDFGLAIRYENNAEFRITKDKTTVGTVDYMSPEQARDSRSADIRSDIYSLGCTFYHKLAGIAPFGKGTLPERIIQHMKTPAPDVRKHNKSIPEGIAAIIARMLAKKPDDRYQTPMELLQDLENPSSVVPSKGKNGKRKRIDMTQVIDNENLDDEIADNGRPEKTGVKVAREPSEQMAPRLRRTSDEPPEETSDPPREETVDSTEHEAMPAPVSKKKESSPVWMYLVGGSVGALGLVLIIALIFGSRQNPVISKPPDKPPGPTPIAVDPGRRIELPPPPAIDTSAAKMTVPALVLPTMDTLPEKADREGLLKEFAGSFAGFPMASKEATVLRMSRLASAGPTSFRTLSDAFAAAKTVEAKPDEFTVVEIHDNGPIFVSNFAPVAKKRILLRGGDGFRPLIVWDPPKKGPLVFCTFAQGSLAIDGIDFVMRASDDGPITIFDLPESDFQARDCTFSIAGKSKEGIALVRRQRVNEPIEHRSTQTVLQRCYVRGPDVTLLAGRETSGALLVDESLVVGYQHPLIDLRGKDDHGLDIACVRSTMVSGHVLLRWRSLGGPGVSPPITGKVLDSILSRDDTDTAPGAMIELADAGEPRKMSWRAANSVYAGWRQLLVSASKTIGGTDLEGWRGKWFYSSGDRAVAETWPRNPPSGLEDQGADTFLPARLPPGGPLAPVAFEALTGPGAIGCVIGKLPFTPPLAIERIYTPTPVASVPPIDYDKIAIDPGGEAYHGERLDLNKVDLGSYLTSKLQQVRPAARVVMHLHGRGTCLTSPLRVRGVQYLALYFERDGKDPLVLKANPTTNPNRLPLIEMTGGHLEIYGARLPLSEKTLTPTIVHVHDGNLTMTRCWLQGPHLKWDLFKNLVSVSNSQTTPTTLLMRDNVLVADKLLLHLTDHVQLKARNNVFVSLGDGVLFDVSSPSVPMEHGLSHNTWAVRHTYFAMRSGPGFQAAGAVLLNANSNAFLNPFADGPDKSTLLRGAEPWASHGAWAWRGQYNAYDVRVHAYFAGLDRTPGPKQTRLDWQTAWGQGEQESLQFAATMAKTLSVEGTSPAAFLQQLGRLYLPDQLRGDPKDPGPPGANLGSLGIAKQ